MLASSFERFSWNVQLSVALYRRIRSWQHASQRANMSSHKQASGNSRRRYKLLFIRRKPWAEAEIDLNLHVAVRLSAPCVETFNQRLIFHHQRKFFMVTLRKKKDLSPLVTITSFCFWNIVWFFPESVKFSAHVLHSSGISKRERHASYIPSFSIPTEQTSNFPIPGSSKTSVWEFFLENSSNVKALRIWTMM